MEKGSKNKNLTLALSLFMGIIAVSFTHNISCMNFNFFNYTNPYPTHINYEHLTFKVYSQEDNPSEREIQKSNQSLFYNRLLYNAYCGEDEKTNTFKNKNEMLFFKKEYGENIEKYIINKSEEIKSIIDEKNLEKLKVTIETIEKKDKTSNKKLLIKILNTYPYLRTCYRPINRAIFKGSTEIIKFLSEKGAQINNNTINRAAISKAKILKYFVKKQNINPNSKNKHGQTPICNAVVKGKLQNFKFLYKNGAKISTIDKYGNNILHFAVESGVPKLIEYILKKAKKYNIDINLKNKHGQTPIHYAALKGKLQNFLRLEESGAKTSIIDNHGNNILNFAFESNSMVLIKYILVNNMADIHQTNNLNIKQLEILLKFFLTSPITESSTVGLIISQNGIDINKNNNPEYKTNLICLIHNLYKYRYLHTFQRKNLINKIKFLIKNGTDINAQNSYGKDALYYAIKGNHLDLIKLLLDQGAKLDIKIDEKEQLITFANYSTLQVTQYLNPQFLNTQSPKPQFPHLPTPITIAAYNLLKETLTAQNELKANLEKINENLSRLKTLKDLEKLGKAVRSYGIPEKKKNQLNIIKNIVEKIRENIGRKRTEHFNIIIPLYDKLRALNAIIVKGKEKIKEKDLENISIVFNYDLFNSEELKPLFKEIESYPKLKDINGSFFHQAMLNHTNLLPYFIGRYYYKFIENNKIYYYKNLYFKNLKENIKNLREDEINIVETITKKICPIIMKKRFNTDKSFKYNQFHRKFMNCCALYHFLTDGTFKFIEKEKNTGVNSQNKKRCKEKELSLPCEGELTGKIIEYWDGEFDGKSYIDKKYYNELEETAKTYKKKNKQN